jgi:hypothetical protein
MLSRMAIAYAYLGKGNWQVDNGGEAERDLMRSADLYQMILATNPGEGVALSNLCTALCTAALAQVRRERDPSVLLARSHDVCERGRADAPDWAGSYDMLSLISLVEASWKLEHGADPSAEVERGLADFHRAVAIDRGLEDAWHKAGELELIAARWAIRQKRSPEAAFASAHQDLVTAVEANRSGGALALLAELHRRRAEWRASRKLPSGGDVVAGLERAEAALQLNPRSGAAMFESAALHLLGARDTSAQARSGTLAKAHDELNAALKLDPNLARDAQPFFDELRRRESNRPPADLKQD